MRNTFNHNLILKTDSYKLSMPVQYPEGTESVFSYIEPRVGGKYSKIVYLGLQAFLREYLTQRITKEMIDEAEAVIAAHGEPFYRENWEYIVREHNGYLPLRIKAIDEGSVVAPGTVLVTVENTDPKCFWLTTHIETMLLRAVWYPTTVATNSWTSKQLINEYLVETGDPAGLSFKLHDFGARGVSSGESAMLGGLAHLVNFMGTDTIEGILGAMRYYDAPVCGFSIPAMEHSTVTSWGKENEAESFRNMLKQFGKPGALLACVSDSYDIMNAASNIWGGVLKEEVIKSGAIVVVRPDSGDPAVVVTEVVRRLDEKFGSTVNAKGYKVLNNVRVIQGDGITTETIRAILFSLKTAGYSADNVAFGQGGALLQQVNRDTLAFAMKCSAIKVNGVWRDVFKDPVTDSGKRSKRGRFEENTELKLRFQNGALFNQTVFEAIRVRSNVSNH
jgi:nicotinamide phosphoribosyltransferase